MIEQENLDLEKKRSCLRFQILKAGGRKGCFCSSLLFSPLVIPSTFLVLTGGGGNHLPKLVLQLSSLMYPTPFSSSPQETLSRTSPSCSDTKCPQRNLFCPSVSNSSIQSIVVIIIILWNRHKSMVLLPRSQFLLLLPASWAHLCLFSCSHQLKCSWSPGRSQ